MSSIQYTLQDQLEKIRQNQYTRQRDIINAFDIIQNLTKQIQTLKLPNKIIKDDNTLKQQSKTKTNTKTKNKIEKQEIIKKEKNLFKRFVSHIVFRNIMQFLSIKDLKQLRLISVFTNYLIENNIEYLIYFKQQRTNYLESLNITKYQKPEIPGLRNIENMLKSQISRKGYIIKFSQRLLSFCSLIIGLQAGSKSHEFLSKFEILKTGLKELRTLQQRWYGIYEKEKRMIKNFISKQGIGDLTSDYENGINFADLNKYVKNLNDFTTQQNYKVICEAFNKNQLLSTISNEMKFLNRLLMRMRAKQNYLFKISDLGNLFFKLTLSYCSLKDVMNSRLVCKKFNQAFQQNSSYHYQFSANRIQKQINSIQTNFNLSLTQDEFLYKTNEQNSLMEIFYCIYQNQNQNDHISTKDFLQINSQQIADFIYKSTNDDQEYFKTLEILKERLGIDILDERNYNTFLQKLQKVKESLQDYHIKLPKLQQQLTIIENKNHYYEM